MLTRIKSNRIICNDKIISGYIYFEDGIITDVTDKELPADKVYDAGNNYVSPGFIDMHTHGGNGFDFIKGQNDVIEGCNFHLTHGTTSICPTLSAAPIAKMEKAVSDIWEVMKGDNAKSNILGAHLEGPYLSAKQCGAQSPDFITPPIEKDFKPLVEKYKGAIARWTYAPENDQNGKFAKYLTDNSIIASAGHTDAIYDDMCTAMENGCNLITHLYSCTSTITRDKGFRRLGVIESAMLFDDMFVEIIADGKHVPPELIKLTLKIKGADSVALVTDSLAPAGSNITHGFMNATEFIIEDGVCKLMDRSAFAGSVATTDMMVRVMINEVGLDLPTAIKMLTKTPANIMKLNKGEISKGKDADIIIFDDDINIQKCFVMGNEVWVR